MKITPIAIAAFTVLLAAVASAKPDLIAKNLVIDGGSTYLEVDPGQKVKLRWTAQNIGSFVTGSDQGIMWSDNSIISRADQLIDTEYLGPLLRNQSSPEIRTVTIPVLATPGKSYYVGVYADYNQEENEENEDNNASNYVIFRIKGTNPGLKPDFTASDATVNKSKFVRQVTRGETITVNWKATNIGEPTATSQQQAVLLSTDETISGVTDFLLRKKSLAEPTATDETHKQELDVKIPDDAVVGAIYYIGVKMDYENNIIEQSGTNNTSNAIQVVVVSDPSPEITIKSDGDELTHKSKINFGNEKVKDKSNKKTIKIINTGTSNLKIKNVLKKGSNRSHFKMKGAKTKKLAPGKTLRLKLTFEPKSKGRKKATIRISSNDPDEKTFDIKLKGKGK